MTEATVEKIARLLHETWRERFVARDWRAAAGWEQLSAQAQDDYRAAARAVLRKLGR